MGEHRAGEVRVSLFMSSLTLPVPLLLGGGLGEEGFRNLGLAYRLRLPLVPDMLHVLRALPLRLQLQAMMFLALGRAVMLAVVPLRLLVGSNDSKTETEKETA